MLSGADLNGDNLRRAYLWSSDQCRVMVADCCIQTAGESDKMRISHVIKTDQWRSDPPRSSFCRVPLKTHLSDCVWRALVTFCCWALTYIGARVNSVLE